MTPPNVFAPFGNTAIVYHSVDSAARPYHLVNSAEVVYPVASFSV